jgi:hypothetical protein
MVLFIPFIGLPLGLAAIISGAAVSFINFPVGFALIVAGIL